MLQGYPKCLDAITDALIYQSKFRGIYCNSFIPANCTVTTIITFWFTKEVEVILWHFEAGKAEITFSMDRLRNDYRNLPPKKPSGIGWIETHYHQKELLRKSYASVVVIGDSNVVSLRRYPTVWRNFILQYKTVNLGIGGDRIENVLWRINDIVLPKSIRSVVIHCGTNNIYISSSDEISVGVVTIARSIFHRYPNIEIIVSGLLPRDIHWSTRRVKINETNDYLRDYCKK